MSTFRCIVALAASKGQNLCQLDINNAFLHSDLIEEVYMTPPAGLSTPPNIVCLLKIPLWPETRL